MAWQENILNSIANEENALGALIQREAERTIDDVTDSTIENILRVSCAERKLLQTIIAKEIILLFKLDETITCHPIPCPIIPCPCVTCKCCLSGTASGTLLNPDPSSYKDGTGTLTATCVNGVTTSLTYTAVKGTGESQVAIAMAADAGTIKFVFCSDNKFIITGRQTTLKTPGEGQVPESGKFTLTVNTDNTGKVISYEIDIVPDQGAGDTKHNSGLVTVAEGGTLKVECQEA